jgi:NAD(P)-dependent dehydrogenase (short-subunit alcohol dehydrogenase family)
MPASAFEKLQVLVTGVEATVARDVARLIVSEGGSVIAADRDAAKLARLDRDLGLYRTPIETAHIDLSNKAELRLWGESLSAFGRLPHLMICCCGAASDPLSRGNGSAQAAQLSDVALGERKQRNCPGLVAQSVLQPTLFLHAEPLRRSAFDRALAVIRHPTLRGVLGRAPGRGVFNPAGLIPYVRIASHLYSIRRPFDGQTDKGGRLRLIPPTDRSPGRVNAA